jgi:hypothetical protein
MSVLDNFELAIFSPQRTIGNIVAQVTIEEEHHDKLVVTKHPVQQGAQISDHAYKMPANLIIHAGWSNSGLESVISDLSSLYGYAAGNNNNLSLNYSQTVYNQLLTLQAQRIPFSITTGKRQYTNMLLNDISVTTTEKTEHTLLATLVCEEVIIVQTTTTILPPAANQASPQQTLAPVNTGNSSLSPGTYFQPGVGANPLPNFQKVFF